MSRSEHNTVDKVKKPHGVYANKVERLTFLHSPIEPIDKSLLTPQKMEKEARHTHLLGFSRSSVKDKGESRQFQSFQSEQHVLTQIDIKNENNEIFLFFVALLMSLERFSFDVVAI